MRTFLHKVLEICVYVSGLNAAFVFFSKRRLTLLGYHSISHPANMVMLRNDAYKHLSVPAVVFEKQLLFLQQHKYTFLRFSDLRDIRDGRRVMPDRPILLYFDDGYKDTYLNAYPILKRLGIPATLFVATDCIDQKKVLWNTIPDSAAAHIFLSWDDMRVMQDVFDVETHTASHRKLPALSSEEIREEYDVSRKRIHEMLGRNVMALSYPKSRWTQETRRLAKEAGFEFVLAHGRGFRHSADFMFLEKIPVGPEDTMRIFKLKLGIYYPLVSMFRK